MSNRSKKTVSTTSAVVTKSSTTSTPLSQPGLRSSAGSGRPPSPTVLSRLQEKNELAGLNDRLAVYIERVRTLEAENGKLTRLVQTQEECVTKESSKIKVMFEGELASARKLLDDISKEKAKLQMEVLGLRKEIEELREKFRNKEADLIMADKKVLSAEAQVADQQARLNDAVNQRRYWEDEFNKLKKELDALNRNYASTKKALEEETVARVDLENRLQSLKEDAAFKAQVHEQEISETFSRSRVVMEEVDHRLQDEYDSRLMEALQQMRADNEEQIRMMRLETEAVFEKKYSELRDAASRNEGLSEKSMSDMRCLKKRVEEQENDISRLNSLIHGKDTRLRDLENQLKIEKDDHMSTVDALTAQIRTLKKTIEDQMEEYRDLMDVKIKLDTEIATYKKLLESEEMRLSNSVGMTVRYSTPGGTEPFRKRKRMEVDGESSFGSSTAHSTNGTNAISTEYQCSGMSHDIVKIDSVDPEGKFIKLKNTSDEKEVALGGWQLKLTAGDNDITYKFHRTLLLKPGTTVTVWSSDLDKTHSPPHDLVMKGQSWLVADLNNAVLSDQKGDEIATYEMKKVSKTTSTSFTRYDGDSSVSQSKNTSKGWLSFLGTML